MPTILDTRQFVLNLVYDENTLSYVPEPYTAAGAGPSSDVNVLNFPATQPVSGPLTDTQLRATAVPVSGTFWQATQPVSGPLTDAQLRATDVPVSGPLTDTQLRATAVPVSGTFWQATQPVSGTVSVSGNVSTLAESYTVRLDEASATITYVGTAPAGTSSASAAWRVKRLDSSTGLSVLYADGNTNFDNVWDNRASLSYS